MTIDVADLPTVSVAVPLYVDCFDRRTGEPKRQKFSMPAQIAIDERGVLPSVCRTTGLSWAGVEGAWDYVGAGGRTFVPYRTRIPRPNGQLAQPFRSLPEEARAAGAMLSVSAWLDSSVAARRMFDRGGPHGSTGESVAMTHESSQARRPDPALWRFDEIGEARIREFERFVFDNAVVGPGGLMVHQRLPVWIVDPEATRVTVCLKHVDDWFDTKTPWAFSAGRLDDALRFQAVLSRSLGRPGVAPVGTVVGLAPEWDLRNDLIEMAMALMRSRVLDLDRHVADLTGPAVGLWHELRTSGNAVREEGEPAARRFLADYVALRAAVGAAHRGGPLATWCSDTRRTAARIVEVEGISPQPALHMTEVRP